MRCESWGPLVKLTGGATGTGEPEIGPRGPTFEPGSRNSVPGPEIRALGPRFRPPGAEFWLPGSNFDLLGPISGPPVPAAPSANFTRLPVLSQKSCCTEACPSKLDPCSLLSWFDLPPSQTHFYVVSRRRCSPCGLLYGTAWVRALLMGGVAGRGVVSAWGF